MNPVVIRFIGKTAQFTVAETARVGGAATAVKKTGALGNQKAISTFPQPQQQSYGYQ